MNPKMKPHPITSFTEDDFDLKTQKAEREAKKNARYKAARKDNTILVIRIVMSLVAVIIALWLYTLVDNYISYFQYQRFHRSISLYNY